MREELCQLLTTWAAVEDSGVNIGTKKLDS
jgi:hypothetical protein